MRDMTITIRCDGRNCADELTLDLDDGNWQEDNDTKIERVLERKGWYSNLDGDYCPKCKEAAREKWLHG